ncbi:hypothetical protein HYV81_05780 [Candidatus Woesearchaeota archaeon]|nr:hypothetical protein [Candidatus Woesearchaeota archaeon]
MFKITGFCTTCSKQVILTIKDYELDDTLMSYRCPKGHKMEDMGCEFEPG